jgi:cell division protein FtsW (lipid II flippase)
MGVSRTRLRLDELNLALIAGLLALCGAWVVTLHAASTVTLTWPDFRASAALAALIVAVPVLWSVSGFGGDQVIFPLIATLAVIGYVTLLRLAPDLDRLGLSAANLEVRQLLYIAGGTVIMLAVARFFRYWHLIRRYQYSMLIVCIGLLAATMAFGTTVNGAKLWIGVGPIQIQPSEIIKIGLVLFLAAYLDERRELMESSWRLWRLSLPPVPYLLPMVLMWGTSLVALVVQNDLGSALLLFGIFLTMVYVGTGRPIYVLAGLITFAVACWAALTFFDRVGIRVQNWLDPWRDPLDAGYQQIQSDFAIASGGALGTGPGNGEPWRIPAVETDFIFSAIAEETGVIGTLAVLTLYAVLVFRGFAIGLRQRDSYLRLVAIGLSATLGIQTIVILGGVLRLIPLTGITLPFVSYGGSSMLTNFLLIGLLLNISSATPHRAQPKAQA